MARRDIRRTASRPPRRRWAVFSLAALAVMAVAAWIAPSVLVHTTLRDRPLEAACAGIAGSVESRAASWRWLGGIEYRDVVVRDASGRAVAIIPEVMSDRGLLGLAANPRDLGTVRLAGVEMLVEVRPGGSSLEDLVAPWLADDGRATVRPPACELELVDGAIELVDLERGDAWRLGDLLAAGTIRSDGVLAGWTVAGRLRHAGSGPATPPIRPDESGPRRLERTTIPARATAVLARDGGWSISSPDMAGRGARSIAVAAHRLPLGVTGVLATRFDGTHLLDGLADVRFDLAFPDGKPDPAMPAGTAAAPATAEAVGTLTVERLAVCRRDSLAELVAIDRCELPFDLVVGAGHVDVRRLEARSPLFRGEATGRLALPDGDTWRWADALVSEQFAVAAEVDLAAASRAIAGGLAVRPDVRVTGGRLEFAASTRTDGGDRVLEVRAAARDLSAVQGLAGQGLPGEGLAATAVASERPLRWNEPFSAWLRGRRSAGGRFRVEEARVTSASAECSAAGVAGESLVQWSVDLEKLRAEAGELLDLGPLVLTGISRGRVEITGGGPREPTRLRATAEVTGFGLDRPGLPVWQDELITLEAEATGRFLGDTSGFVVDEGRATLAAAGDTLEATVSGGLLVDPTALGSDEALVRSSPAAAPDGQPLATELALAGDLAHWHARLAGWLPDAVSRVAPGGRLTATATAVERPPSWQLTNVSAEIEQFTCEPRQTAPGRDPSAGGWRIVEPRVVASGAGLVTPASGRLEVTVGELLSTSLSLRTGGLTWQTVAGGDPLDAVRGRAQWQCDMGRLARWLLPAETAAAWSVTGRGWGTVEVADGRGGVNVLVEATGSQLSVSRTAASREPGGRGPMSPAKATTAAASSSASAAEPLWAEPQATLLMEITRQVTAAGDRLRIDRVALESSTLAIAAAGGVGDWSARRTLELDGTVSYDWEQLSRLAAPWTAGRLRLAGAGGRPFALRGPLAADRQGGAALRGLALDTSLAWQAADIVGFRIGPGEMPVRLLEGQLAFGPFDVEVSGGRVRSTPWLSLVGDRHELVVPPGRIVERVAVSGGQVQSFLTWLSPLLGRTAEAAGFVTLDVAGGRLPLGDPLAGEMAGQVILENLEVAPSPLVQPLVSLIQRLQSAIDPRFAIGDKTVLLRVRPEPIRVRLADGRFAHDGLVIDSGQLVLRSSGSVAADGGLSMAVEISFRGDLAGQTPLVAQLLRTPLLIPLKGTIERPQFDAAAIDRVVGRIVENTAQAIIGDAVGRGLDAFFGAPAPAGAAPGLVLPR